MKVPQQQMVISNQSASWRSFVNIYKHFKSNSSCVTYEGDFTPTTQLINTAVSFFMYEKLEIGNAISLANWCSRLFHSTIAKQHWMTLHGVFYLLLGFLFATCFEHLYLDLEKCWNKKRKISNVSTKTDSLVDHVVSDHVVSIKSCEQGLFGLW